MQDKAITEIIVNVLHLAIKHTSDESEFYPFPRESNKFTEV